MRELSALDGSERYGVREDDNPATDDMKRKE